MQLTAFVVMPFGKKRPTGFDEHQRGSDSATCIDFDEVWLKLFKPALEQAGCRPFRADSETAAGDIRTDMFFELVTADLVLADITVSNPNVFYELGVRHGVCRRGVFVVTGNLTSGRAFDIAQDRSFSYDGKLFLADGAGTSEEERQKAVRRLSVTLKQAIAADLETIGSPVYSHLPGLIPVNWDHIKTSRAQHFHALQDDWLDCVRKAQSEGHPGDILTLAEDAPTRLHRTQILSEASLALINMCRYPAAESVLREVIAADPDCAKERLQLARALSHQAKMDDAERELRSILRQHEDDPYAGDLLGQVFRHLWQLTWKKENADKRIEKARDTSQLANMAIASFARAHRFDTRAYYAGFNALVLCKLLQHVQPTLQQSGSPASALNLEELATVVDFVARHERERAVESGNYVEQFWTTTTLSGIALMRGNTPTALDRIREACCVPGITSYQLQSFRERLTLLNELGFEPAFVESALGYVMAAQKPTHCTCERVFVYSGYSLNDPRFGPGLLAGVTERIKKVLDNWNLKEGDLAICEGTRECDIVFAEECLKKKARVRLMILEQNAGEARNVTWPFADSEWLRRFHNVVRREENVEVWFHSKHLGPPVLASSDDGEGDSKLRHRQWIRHQRWIGNTARIEAEPVTDANNPGEARHGALYGLFVWDGTTRREGREDPSYLIEQVNSFEGFRGEVEIIDPGAVDKP